MTNRPNRLLKKASSKGCMSFDNLRIKVVIAAKLKAANTIHNAPRNGPGKTAFAATSVICFSDPELMGETLFCDANPDQSSLHMAALCYMTEEHTVIQNTM